MKNRLLLVAGAAVAISALVYLCPKSNAQSKTVSLEDQVAHLQAELRQAKAIIMKLAPDAKRAREMPIQVAQRKAVLGSGAVLQLENMSPKTLPLKVSLISPTFSKTNTFDIVLDAARVTPTVKEIGHAQGWSVAPGDIVEVESQGYDLVKKRFE